MNFILSFLGIIIFMLIFLQLYNRIGILRLITLSVVSFFSLYVITSSFFFLFEKFNIFVILITNIIITIGILFYFYTKQKSINWRGVYKEKNIWFIIIMIIFIVPFTVDKFEFFGMGQDEGVYQTKAIDLLYGKTDTQQDLSEYYTLDSKEQEEFNVKRPGFDNYDSRMPTLSSDEELSVVSGIYHGIPTFAALLTLWGDSFGVENMSGIQTVFLILSIVLVYFICCNLNINRKWSIFSCFVFMFSPITIWVSKSALTEMFLTVIVCSIIYFITERNKDVRWISSLFITVFAFYHVSIYSIMPLFVSLYMFLYFYEKDKQYLYSILISTLGYGIGFFVTSELSPSYVFNNYNQLYGITKNIISKENLQFVVLSVVLLICIIVLLLRFSKNTEKIFLKIDSLKNIKKYSSILIKILLVLSVVFVILKTIQSNSLIHFEFMTLSAYTYVTGIILIPIVYIILFCNTEKFLTDRNKIILVFLFVYQIVIYSFVFKPDTRHYYYYARYLVPYIPIVTIFATLLLNQYKLKITFLMSIFILIIDIPYNITLATQKDDSRIEWDILNNIASMVESDDIIIVDNSLDMRLYLPIRAMTGAKVYPESNFDYVKTNLLSEEDLDCYFISTSNELENYSVVYRDINTVSDNLIAENYNPNKNKLIPFPEKFVTTNEIITLYKYNENRVEYNFSTGDFEYEGFGNLEKDFVWTNTENSYIQCFLDKKSYILNLEFGPGIPLDKLNREVFEVEVLINDNLLENIQINKENNGEIVQINIPEEYVVQGENIVTFKSELWSPSDYGGEDTRKLGFSLKSAQFIDEVEK